MTEHQFTPIPNTTGYSKGCRCAECKKAQSDYDRARYPKEREKRIANAKQWRETNAELHEQQNAEWYKRNKVLVKARTKAYQFAHPEKRLIYGRNYITKHGYKWKNAHPEKVRFYNKKRKAMKRNITGSHTFEEWTAILEKFNHACARCGSSDNLTQDHVVPVKLGGSNYASNLQPLCRSCNSWKHLKAVSFLPPSYWETPYLPTYKEQ